MRNNSVTRVHGQVRAPASGFDPFWSAAGPEGHRHNQHTLQEGLPSHVHRAPSHTPPATHVRAASRAARKSNCSPSGPGSGLGPPLAADSRPVTGNAQSNPNSTGGEGVGGRWSRASFATSRPQSRASVGASDGGLGASRPGSRGCVQWHKVSFGGSDDEGDSSHSDGEEPARGSIAPELPAPSFAGVRSHRPRPSLVTFRRGRTRAGCLSAHASHTQRLFRRAVRRPPCPT